MAKNYKLRTLLATAVSGFAVLFPSFAAADSNAAERIDNGRDYRDEVVKQAQRYRDYQRHEMTDHITPAFEAMGHCDRNVPAGYDMVNNRLVRLFPDDPRKVLARAAWEEVKGFVPDYVKRPVEVVRTYADLKLERDIPRSKGGLIHVELDFDPDVKFSRLRRGDYDEAFEIEATLKFTLEPRRIAAAPVARETAAVLPFAFSEYGDYPEYLKAAECAQKFEEADRQVARLLAPALGTAKSFVAATSPVPRSSFDDLQLSSQDLRDMHHRALYGVPLGTYHPENTLLAENFRKAVYADSPVKTTSAVPDLPEGEHLALAEKAAAKKATALSAGDPEVKLAGKPEMLGM